MEIIKTERTKAQEIIQELLRNSSTASVQNPPPSCDLCNDAGLVYENFKRFGITYNRPKKCVCALRQLRQKRLAQIPARFADANLKTLKPKSALQKTAVDSVIANPEKSFMFCGKFGTGKTHLLWSLYQAAVMRDAPRIVACKLITLLDEYKRHIDDSMSNVDRPFLPRLAAADLRQSHTRYSIFFDDIDKDKPTEYVAKQVFDLADAIYENNHQIVTTTNLKPAELVRYFNKADERFGGGIVRRLMDNATIIEMF